MSKRVQTYKSPSSATGLSTAIWEKFSPETITSGASNGLWKHYNFGQLGAAATDGLEDWVVTLVEGGGGESTITYGDAHGGTMVLTTDAADYDGINMQYGQGEMIDLDSCKWFGMEARYQVSDADTVDFFMGLTTTDTTILASSSAHAITVAQRVGVYHLDTSAALLYTHDNNTTDTEGTLTTLSDATYVKVGFDIEVSKGLVNWYVNGTKTVSKYVTLVGTEVRPSLAVRTGSTAAKTFTFTDLAFGAEYS